MHASLSRASQVARSGHRSARSAGEQAIKRSHRAFATSVHAWSAVTSVPHAPNTTIEHRRRARMHLGLASATRVNWGVRIRKGRKDSPISRNAASSVACVLAIDKFELWIPKDDD